jgi:hypothetical protein
VKKARIFQEGLAKSAAGIEKPKKFGIGSGSGLQASPGNVSKVADIVLYWVKGGSSDPERLCDAFADALLYVLDDTRWAQLGKEVACMQTAVGVRSVLSPTWALRPSTTGRSPRCLYLWLFVDSIIVC